MSLRFVKCCVRARTAVHSFQGTHSSTASCSIPPFLLLKQVFSPLLLLFHRLITITRILRVSLSCAVRRNPRSNHERSCVNTPPQFWSFVQYANSHKVRFLDLIKPFTPLLPEVAAPESKVPFNQKLMWTGVREHSTQDAHEHETDSGNSARFSSFWS